MGLVDASKAFLGALADASDIAVSRGHVSIWIAEGKMNQVQITEYSSGVIRASVNFIFVDEADLKVLMPRLRKALDRHPTDFESTFGYSTPTALSGEITFAPKEAEAVAGWLASSSRYAVREGKLDDFPLSSLYNDDRWQRMPLTNVYWWTTKAYENYEKAIGKSA